MIIHTGQPLARLANLAQPMLMEILHHETQIYHDNEQHEGHSIGDQTFYRNAQYFILGNCMERAKGIEPSSEAWKATALPLCYARSDNGSFNASPLSTQDSFSYKIIPQYRLTFSPEYSFFPPSSQRYFV